MIIIVSFHHHQHHYYYHHHCNYNPHNCLLLLLLLFIIPVGSPSSDGRGSDNSDYPDFEEALRIGLVLGGIICLCICYGCYKKCKECIAFEKAFNNASSGTLSSVNGTQTEQDVVTPAHDQAPTEQDGLPPIYGQTRTQEYDTPPTYDQARTEQAGLPSTYEQTRTDHG